MRLRNISAVILCALAAAPAFCQPATPSALRKVGIDQRLNMQVPLETMLVDEGNHPARLGQYFHGKPVLLAMVYYQCPMLCNMTLNGVVHAMEGLTLKPGEDFEIVIVSFDARETSAMAKAKRDTYMQKLNRPDAEAGWHFLTGNAVSVRKVAESVGFHYEWDSMTNQFAHASGIMVLTPTGRVSKYFYGIEYRPRDLRLGLVEASENRIGTAVDKILLFCYHYDPATGKYGVVIMNVVRVLAFATVFALGLFMFVSLRRDRRNAPLAHGRLS
jgi:protein SCO1